MRSAALPAFADLPGFASLSILTFFGGASRIRSAGLPAGRWAGKIVISGGSVWKLRNSLPGLQGISWYTGTPPAPAHL